MSVSMELKQLTFNNFRNIKYAELQPDRYFNILHGLNAQGKTNILEGICLLGSLKSFRTSRNDDLIKHGSNEAQIKGFSLKNRVTDEMRLDIKKAGKTARLNGKVVSQPENYLNCLRPIVFSPEEVSLAKGGPSGRRRLIDRAVFQATPGYLTIVQNYDRQLKQRNTLLKEKSSDAQIRPWTDAIIKTGAQIRYTRKKYIDSISNEFVNCYKHISGESELSEILYKTDGDDLKVLEGLFADELDRQQDQDYKYGMTLSGPHRDDIHFLLEEKSLRDFGSQGQQRSFILALKTAQVLDLEKRFNETPLLLLDDLLGELDRQRQDYFFEFLVKMQAQVFITTTDTEPLINSGIGKGSYFQVEDGVLHTRHQ